MKPLPLLAAATLALATAHAQTLPRVQHVLLISVDGLHGLDLTRYAQAHPGSSMAALLRGGLNYSNARSALPSDSFPGLLALVTGGSPRSTGVYYDDSFDRALAAPGSDCKTLGSEVVYDESVDANPDALDGGGRIDAAKLPRDPAHGCAPVYPHSFLRVNTVFEVARAAGLPTAWADKHLAYDLVNGPSGAGVADLYTPEINAGGTTGSVAKTTAYDALKVKAVLNQIDGKTRGGAPGTVPAIFGMNFQAVSVGQKTTGYLDAAGSPTPDLDSALAFVDTSLGQFVSELRARQLYDSTLIVLTAKHGQSPVDPKLRRVVDDKKLSAAVEGVRTGLLAQLTSDTVGLVWLTDGSQADAVVSALSAAKADLGIDHIIAGAELRASFGDPAQDSRVPDLIVIPQKGVIYAKPSATKIAEHGGFSDDDSHIALLLSNPALQPGQVGTAVEAAQVAPTILAALGLDPNALQAVQQEHTEPLPLP